MSHGSFWDRLTRGTRWTWLGAPYRDALPEDLDARVMTLESRDRLHAKQGRSTARVVFHSPSGPLPVYLKRHYRPPWRDRLAALFDPNGRHSPAAAEWERLERARALGIAVPESVAAGERIGPWGALQSYLMVAELTGCDPLHEAIPLLAGTLDPAAFAACKRRLVVALAEVTAKLHRAHSFHKDRYLCHFYLDRDRAAEAGLNRARSAPSSLDAPPTRVAGVAVLRNPGPGPRDRGPSTDPSHPEAAEAGLSLYLIDLHRLNAHRWWPDRWRWKDLGQLWFSTIGVAGIDDRDRLRFWALYCRRLGLRRARWHRRMIALKTARYLAHNR